MTFALLILLLGDGAPDTLSLAEAYDAARRNFPPLRQVELYEDITKLRVDNLDARRHPRLSASAKALYRSDVPELPLSMPGFSAPEISKDQYEAALNVEQLVYDGGLTSAQRALEQASGELAREEVEVALNERLDRISEAYFTALLRDAACALLASHRDDLTARREAVDAQIDEGLRSASESDVLSVEILKLEQQIDEARSKRKAALNTLAEFTGLKVDDEVTLATVDLSLSDPASVTARPEYRVFELQKDRLELQQRLAAVQNRPTVSGFGIAAYGRPPGMDIFDNDFSPYFSLGVQVRWPFWDWGVTRRERQIAALRQDVIETQEEAFSEGIRAAAAQVHQQIVRLHAALERDGRIIQLRKRIADRATEQLDNGTISATDYLLEQQAAQQARLDRERHRIELGFAQVRYLGILGRYDEIR